MKRVSLIFGTRPEAIKLCPLVSGFKEHPEFEPHVCVTGQHRRMLDQALDTFDLEPDVDLGLMEPNQTLADLTSRAVTAIDAYLAEHKPDSVIVRGDTTTAFCCALAAFYRKICVGHVEAGLRTWNKFAPFSEEINRVLISRIVDLHFAPTQWAADNLLREGDTTERPEGVASGTVRLVGTDSSRIQDEVSRLLSDDIVFGAQNPYGDGLATGRIVNICLRGVNN